MSDTMTDLATSTPELDPTPAKPETSAFMTTEEMEEITSRFTFKFVGGWNGGLGMALRTGNLSDVTLIVGDDKTQAVGVFHVHKLILSLSSNVFHAMFYGPLKDIESQVEIKDLTPEGFKIMLDYVYTGMFPANMPVDFAINVLFCARKYMIESLEGLILDYFKEIYPSPDIVFSVLEASNFFDFTELEILCWLYIDKHTKAVIESESFTNIGFETLFSFLKRESLTTNESAIFESVLKWGKAECSRRNEDPTPANIRQVIGKCIFLLRLASMSATEFADGPGNSGLLSEAEVGNVLLHVCSTNGKSISSLLFSPMRRVGVTQQTFMCNCIGFNIKCFFCLRESGALVLSGGTKRPMTDGDIKKEKKELWKFPPLQTYCSCRVRGRCPAAPGIVKRRPLSYHSAFGC